MKREFSRRKQPKTSSHKVQIQQAAVSFHGCCNRFCAVVADSVVLLHSTRQRSRTTIKKETQIQQEKKPKTSSHKVQILQAAVSVHGCCNRFCAVVADLVVVLHSTRQRWRREQQTTRGKYTAETEPEKILQGPVSSLC